MDSSFGESFDVFAMVSFLFIFLVGSYLVVTSNLNLAFSVLWGVCGGLIGSYIIDSLTEREYDAVSSGVDPPSLEYRKYDIKRSLSEIDEKINNVNTDEEIKEIEENMSELRFQIDDLMSHDE